MRIEIRDIIKKSRSGKGILVEMESPQPGAVLWMPISKVKFKTSEYSYRANGSEIKTAEIPRWLYEKEFGAIAQTEDEIPF